MAKITLKQAAFWCGGYVEKKYEDISFYGANNDTRTLESGQLFVALQGARDGHEFIPDAMGKGAAAVLCSRKVGDYPAIIVEDPRIALGDIARQERKRLGVKVVGITGSVGKSTTKEMVAEVLGSTFKVAKSPANHNNDLGLPMAILAMKDGVEIAVLEMGMNHFREMAYLSGIAQPDIAVIVNIGTMHIEFLGSVEGIRRAKMEIVEGMNEKGKLLLNGDDIMLRSLKDIPVQEISYFGSDDKCRIRYSDVEQDQGDLKFHVHTEKDSFQIIMALEGKHYVPDAMAAVSVGLMLGVTPERIQESLAGFQNMAGRQQIYTVGDYTIIKDCYNAGPESMEAALNVLGNRTGRRVAVLGEMLELGRCAPAEHYRIGRIAAENADIILAYGPDANRIYTGAITGGVPEANTKAFEDREQLILWLKRFARPGDVMLFKGSRGMHMEQVLDAFLADKTEKQTEES